ncbi:MAG: DEAD/DEAH box helicase [Bdellovibrionales bacterium]|nr:DEAD/DEAH box helicase [Bdellovibrionales bacterium]
MTDTPETIEIPENNQKIERDARSFDSFEQLLPDDPILARLQALGFTKPTDVQARTIPLAREGGDLLVQAQTGSGKTLAFGIPLLLSLRAQAEKEAVDYTYGLIITPTRELATQVSEAISQVSGDITPAVVIGGVDINPQVRALKEDCRIVVGTPGRILDLLRQKKLRLNRCRYFALDEADEMLSMGFIEDIRVILSRLPDKRQGLFVSATITGRVEMLAHSFLHKPERILVGEYRSDIPSIEHCYCEIGNELMAKPAALCDLIETMRPRSVIIFCNTKSDTQLVEALLRRRGFDARRINSDLTQAKRDRIMRQIRAGDLQILVATDIAARGLDIEQIDLVVNYTIHDQAETYIHRTGRTGRAGRSGRAVSLVGPRDHGAFHFLKKVVQFEFKKLPLPSEDEVADARLTHLYELVRQSQLKLNDRELLVAAKLLKELGGVTDPTEELTHMVAKLVGFTVEHAIRQEAKALDEELDSDDTRESNDEGRKRSKRKRERGDRDRRHDEEPRAGEKERSARRDRDRDRDRGKDSGKDRERDNRPDRKRERGGEDTRRDRPERERRSAEREAPPANERDREEQEANEVRLYIGQGTEHGMTNQLFTDLAAELAELNKSDLRKLIIRERYGFVDLYAPQAERLTASLNGIEYNGHPLPVELATTLSPRERRRPSGGRGRRRHQR